MRRRVESPVLGNIWPAFTDVLGGLLVVLIFLVTIFVIAEVLVSREMLSQGAAIGQLSTITDYLEGLLGEAKDRAANLETQVDELQDALSLKEAMLAETQAQLRAAEASRQQLELSRDEARADADYLSSAVAALQADRARLVQAREASDGRVSLLEQQAGLLSARVERMAAEVERLNRVLAQSEETVAERDATVERQAARIEEMDGLIKRRLLDRVEELESYASDFFGRLREVFADNPDIKVVGDRFVFQSEVLFPSGEAELVEAGKRGLDKFVEVYEQVVDRLPQDLPVIIEVQGHTDRIPISTPEFASNWELSQARALGVVSYLISRGIPPERLAATGMGEFHPVDPGTGPEALRRNRRIEIKITSL